MIFHFQVYFNRPTAWPPPDFHTFLQPCNCYELLSFTAYWIYLLPAQKLHLHLNLGKFFFFPSFWTQEESKVIVYIYESFGELLLFVQCPTWSGINWVIMGWWHWFGSVFYGRLFWFSINQHSNIVQLSNWNPYFYRFRCHHPLIAQLSLA